MPGVEARSFEGFELVAEGFEAGAESGEGDGFVGVGGEDLGEGGFSGGLGGGLGEGRGGGLEVVIGEGVRVGSGFVFAGLFVGAGYGWHLFEEGERWLVSFR